jgi:rod shape-determining protein MreD
MTPSLGRRLDTLARRLLPCASTLAISMVGVVPLHIPAWPPAALSMSLIAVFYWSLYRPDLMPAWAAFGLGLAQDVLGGLPLGITACVLITVHAAVGTSVLPR